MEVILENTFLTVRLTRRGAEITSIKDKKDHLEYIWTGDAQYWERQTPILFPIVGKVRNNQYTIENATYDLSQHGFARDSMFEFLEQSKQHAVFRLAWSKETFIRYPYKFELVVEYHLKNSKLEVKYVVRNMDSDDMYYSIGAHPGFNCPVLHGDEGVAVPSIEDHYFEFESKENGCVMRLNEYGLIKNKKERYLKDQDKICISSELFKDGALIFNDLKSKHISLKNTKNAKGVTLDYTGFPFLGLWSKPGAPFVCIEPWFGHADFEDFEGDFRKKPGILKLNKKEEQSFNYSISILV